MKRAPIFLLFLVCLISTYAYSASGGAEPGQPSLYETAYTGMDGFMLAADKYYALQSMLDDAGRKEDWSLISQYDGIFALLQKDYERLNKVRSDGGMAPADLSPRYTPGLPQGDFKAAGEFITGMTYKNRGRGALSIIIAEADFELSIDAAYAQFQPALKSFLARSPAAIAEIDRLYGSGAATQAAYIAADVLKAAATLEQNSAASAFYKKYSSILDVLDDTEDRPFLISLLPYAVGAFAATGDMKSAEEVAKKLNKLKALDKVASKGMLTTFDEKIAKPDVMYDMMADQFGEVYMDEGSDSILAKKSGGGGGSSAAPSYKKLKFTVSNISPPQFENLYIYLSIMPGFIALDDETVANNTVTAAMLTSIETTSVDVAAFINTMKFDDFVITAKADGEYSVTAKATGIPREKFDASAAAFEFFAMPDDLETARPAAILLASLRSAYRGSTFRELLYSNIEAAAARALNDISLMPESATQPATADIPQTRLLSLLWAQRALNAAALGKYSSAATLLDVSDKSFNSDPGAAPLPQISGMNLMAFRIASGEEPDPRAAADKLKSYLQTASTEDQISLHIDIANCLYSAGDYENAYSEYTEAGKLAENFTRMEQARALVAIGKGNTLIMRSKHEDAASEFSTAATESDAAGAVMLAASARAHLANVLLYTAGYEGAATNARAAATSAEAFSNSRLEWQALYTLARALDAQGRADDAMSAYLAAAALIESPGERTAGQTPVQLSLDQQDVYRYAASLAARMAKPELALQILDRGQSSALREQFEKAHVSFKDPGAGKAAENIAGMQTKIGAIESDITKESSSPEVNEAKKEIAGDKEKLQESQRGFIKYVSGLESTHSGLAAMYNIEPVELVKVRAKLPADMAVVYYLLGDSALYVFYVRSDAIGYKEVPLDLPTFEANVRLFKNLVSAPPAAGATSSTAERVAKTTSDTGARLYDTLVKPVEPYLDGVDKLAIIPNGILNFIPFEALNTGGKYLIEKYSVFYLDSLSLLAKGQGGAKRTGALYAFGNADDTLPAAEKEVKKISAIFAKPSVYIRSDATEEKAKELSESGGIFHFATHGTLDFRDISKSFITLAGGGGEDGKFTIEEVWGYWWGDATLVSLSACNTASGDLTVRGKAVNPASAFLNAGAPSVLATLWSVDDAATALLMEKFYKNLSSMGKAQALRAAQVDMLKQQATSYPYYWAPFTLIGDWR